ncbi:recombinase family protein [Kutzneria sp. CA-103260]|uniref:recombinase family protein n=1 Tax=Kutzneria sp. CA-103260 TaxID=2802641 RepID=UPI001BF16106|nr:recombinase family protein [Kutzneria sp. CA-103260]QUQ64586.1 recombinase [Kutzneria sp. CA-103260]
MGIEVVDIVDGTVGPAAFYGRCSTEDRQDPRTSRGWQVGAARRFIEPFGAVVVEEFFDVGQSRSVPWERRPAASRLLAALKDPDRRWTAVVVGEGTRCWFGNQFSLAAPRLAAYGVDLWVPELGGRFDARNPSHTMLMSVLGGMSASERQHVQARVRAAMDAQVINEGRHQGGRAPYGYVVVDGGPHPNPSRAALGQRLRVLALDKPAARVVRRIFAECLDGMGDRGIAAGLNRDGVSCPSARRPEQNRHRRGDGWQGGTVRAILNNPRYTGYAVFGRWTKYEKLLDPDDVAAGCVVRFRRSEPGKVVRSLRRAHPAIIDVEDFTLVQLRRRAKAAGGLAALSGSERSGRTTTRVYVLRGRLRCAVCGRKMQAGTRPCEVFYRCLVRTLRPDSPVRAWHPVTVYIRESLIRDVIDRWLVALFAPDHVDETVSALVASQTTATSSSTVEDASRSLVEAETGLRRFRNAIASGVDPVAMVDGINRMQAQRAAAQAALSSAAAQPRLSPSQVRRLVTRLGDVEETLNGGNDVAVEALYARLGLAVRYDAFQCAVELSIHPGCPSAAGSVRRPRLALTALCLTPDSS